MIPERLRRHPVPVRARFRHSLVLTYAFPRTVLERLVPPGLLLDADGGLGFAACALVQTERLRPAFAPPTFGRDFFLTGYRVFVRVARAPSLRGLLILRSDTDSRLMAALGNVLTHYRYRLAAVRVQERPAWLEIDVRTAGAEADVHVAARLDAHALPSSSPFATESDARRFAGPLPYTFHVEGRSGAIVAVRAVRSEWEPTSVEVDVRRSTFFERSPFDGRGVLANAFHVAGVDYAWQRGRVL